MDFEDVLELIEERLLLVIVFSLLMVITAVGFVHLALAMLIAGVFAIFSLGIYVSEEKTPNVKAALAAIWVYTALMSFVGGLFIATGHVSWVVSGSPFRGVMCQPSEG